VQRRPTYSSPHFATGRAAAIAKIRVEADIVLLAKYFRSQELILYVQYKNNRELTIIQIVFKIF
jgi:hypothetical protein